jgi:UDP-2,3-diacylglucosamine hydrolase
LYANIALTSLPGAPESGVPAMSVLTAPAAWHRIDFISDLHLGPETPRTFDAWATYMRSTHADAVLLLGDWMELWVGDDSRFQGFDARCAEVLADTARQRTVGFMAGNRDFLIGQALLDDCGVLALPDPTRVDAFGQRILLTHGDSLCLSDTAYQQFRAQVRDPVFQRHFLDLPMATRRDVARKIRNESEQRKGDGSTPLDWADVDAAAAATWLEHASSPTMIHGHTHRPGSNALAPGRTRHVLSDWDLDHLPHRAEVLRWTAAGLARLTPAAAAAA